MAHLNTLDLLELLATFVVGNIVSESIKYFVTKAWTKVDHEHITFLDIEAENDD